MLRALTIENYGLISEARVEFDIGMTVLTGETGSGKTMLLGALGFVLGDRATADVVRAGAERARVTLDLDIGDEGDFLAEEGFSLDPGEPLTLWREISASGKSSARIGGRPATATQLRMLGERVVDRVGQHEQQRLLARGYHLDLLDRFAGDDALVLRRALSDRFTELEIVNDELHALDEEERRADAALNLARHTLTEIDAAKLEPDEDMRLRERRDRLTNIERVTAALSEAHHLLADESSATEMLGSAVRSLASIERFGVRYAEMGARLRTVQEELGDAASALMRELEESEFDAAELEQIGSRLDILDGLKRKHGGSLERVLEARAHAAETIERYGGADRRRKILETRRGEISRAFDRNVVQLSELRRAASVLLEEQLASELEALAMRGVRLSVALQTLERPGARGAESAEFVLRSAGDDVPRALAKIASGGELSRVLLALTTVLFDRRECTALVFDEIDAGIGGETANAVAERLGRLSRRSQVICVTHLAQIAAWSDTHIVLSKRESNGAAQIVSETLHRPDAVRDEIARMLSGRPNDVAREHAATLLKRAGEKRIP
jgi:DNA repair protein RecN (Recombination protein N)